MAIIAQMAKLAGPKAAKQNSGAITMLAAFLRPNVDGPMLVMALKNKINTVAIIAKLYLIKPCSLALIFLEFISSEVDFKSVSEVIVRGIVYFSSFLFVLLMPSLP